MKVLVEPSSGQETKNNLLENPENKDSHVRSVLKGITWRVVATTTTIIIAYFITGEISDALKIGGIEFIGKIFIYYLHERAWTAVPRGTFRKKITGSV